MWAPFSTRGYRSPSLRMTERGKKERLDSYARLKISGRAGGRPSKKQLARVDAMARLENFRVLTARLWISRLAGGG